MQKAKNLLLILGNGFDLAHKESAIHQISEKQKNNTPHTSYTDFIKYLPFYQVRDRNNILNEANNKSFIKPSSFDNPQSSLKIKITEDHLDGIDATKYYQYNPLTNVQSLVDFKKIIEKSKAENEPGVLENSILSHFFDKLGYQNWVDIENEYFNELYKRVEAGKSLEVIKEFNDEFEGLIKVLGYYLRQWNAKKSVDEITAHIDKYCKDYKNANGIKSIHVLNFNYTNTFSEHYLCDSTLMEVNHINGKLNDPSNPLIFGYGNETDRRYKFLEKKEENEYLRFMKSYLYCHTSNYQNLLKFIDSHPFDIEILGHSCGSSDSVLFKTVFEHRNCKSINLKYYEKKDASNNVTDDFKEKGTNISRHFSDKYQFRKKLRPKDKSEPLIPLE
jgi:hypothetical protein